MTIYPNIINVLPPELISDIFLLCLPEGPYLRPSPSHAPLLLCHVCSEWRAFVLECPVLWQSICLSHTWGHEGRDLREKQKTRFREQLDMYISASKGSLSSIAIGMFNLLGANNPDDLNMIKIETGTFWKDFLRDGLLHNTRVLKSLRLDSGVPFNILQSFYSMPPDSLPELEVLHINLNSDYQPLPDRSELQVFGKAHKLRKVVLDGAPSLSLVALDLPWKQLTSLNLLSSQSTLFFYSILKECKLLTFLHIDICSRGPPPTQSIVAPHLRDLRLLFRTKANPSVFDQLSFPVLTNLKVGGDPSNLALAFSFRSYTESLTHPFDQLGNLRSLSLGYQDLRADRLISILRLLPLVEDLAVDSDLGDYTGFFLALHVHPDQDPQTILMPLLKSLKIFVQLYNIDFLEFNNLTFFEMLSSRSGNLPSTSAKLQKVNVTIQLVAEHDIVDVEALISQSEDRDFGDLDLHIAACDELDTWLMEPVIGWGE